MKYDYSILNNVPKYFLRPEKIEEYFCYIDKYLIYIEEKLLLNK